ncbi:beta-galactosidase [Ideonella sp.]|uniref:beta-galactosidase n=1 Tax=Ideonella sp. TaxID=1929293 RepID=UPI003BB610C9
MSLITLNLPAETAPIERDYLNLGHYQRPGRSLTVNSRYLELDGQPWMPVMGEFHYSRFPEDEWALELRKMKAGGVDVVASYVIWNHHEAHDGQFNWQGRRDLGRFVRLAAEVGLYVYLRPGPWSHAEVRLGGFPAWLPAIGELRCNAPAYLRHVARFYQQVGAQVAGLMWADGGPVIGLQLENEYDRIGPGCGAEHIAELKRLAIEAGLCVPLYTVTGWPTLDIPPREVLPVSGAYADGFWSGSKEALPPSGVFLFNTGRAIGEMGNVGGTPAAGQIDKRHYPFFLAEAGGGMHVSYHRRPAVSTDDVAATALVQIGSGANLYGYYMYHGGVNPPCDTGPLNETQASGYPNDVPLLGYDFRAPLGQYGQVRESWGRLRCLHLFMQAFGAELAPCEAVLPADAPAQADDRSQPRVALRAAADGAGFVFINNHLRHHPLPDFAEVQLSLHGAGAAQAVPMQAFDLPSSCSAIWPLNQRLGTARLLHSTLQPLTRLAHPTDPARQCWVLFAVPGLPRELLLATAGLRSVQAEGAQIEVGAQGWCLRLADSAAPLTVQLIDDQGTAHQLLVLSRADAERSQRLDLGGRQRLVTSSHPLVALGQDRLQFTRPEHEAAWLRITPSTGLAAPGLVEANGSACAAWPATAETPAGQAPLPLRFERLQPQAPAASVPPLRWGPPISWRAGPVPLAPEDAQFAAGEHLAIELPADLPTDAERVLLAIRYLGDAARLHADGALVDDNFYDGHTWWVGIDRFIAADGRWPKLTLAIVPADPDAPIFLEPEARAALRSAAHGAQLLSVDLSVWRPEQLALSAHAAASAEQGV